MTREEAKEVFLNRGFIDGVYDGYKWREACIVISKWLEQEPRKGHWIEYTRVLIPEPFNKWEQAWYCSECGYGNQESDESTWLEWNYCPKCGAKMEVEDGNDNN